MMAAAAPESADVTGARKLPTAEELSEALKVDVYDREGKTKPLGELVKGQRTVLVFTRHFCECYSIAGFMCYARIISIRRVVEDEDA